MRESSRGCCTADVLRRSQQSTWCWDAACRGLASWSLTSLHLVCIWRQNPLTLLQRRPLAALVAISIRLLTFTAQAHPRMRSVGQLRHFRSHPQERSSHPLTTSPLRSPTCPQSDACWTVEPPRVAVPRTAARRHAAHAICLPYSSKIQRLPGTSAPDGGTAIAAICGILNTPGTAAPMMQATRMPLARLERADRSKSRTPAIMSNPKAPSTSKEAPTSPRRSNATVHVNDTTFTTESRSVRARKPPSAPASLAAAPDALSLTRHNLVTRNAASKSARTPTAGVKISVGAMMISTWSHSLLRIGY